MRIHFPGLSTDLGHKIIEDPFSRDIDCFRPSCDLGQLARGKQAQQPVLPAPENMVVTGLHLQPSRAGVGGRSDLYQHVISNTLTFLSLSLLICRKWKQCLPNPTPPPWRACFWGIQPLWEWECGHVLAFLLQGSETQLELVEAQVLGVFSGLVSLFFSNRLLNLDSKLILVFFFFLSKHFNKYFPPEWSLLFFFLNKYKTHAMFSWHPARIHVLCCQEPIYSSTKFTTECFKERMK